MPSEVAEWIGRVVDNRYRVVELLGEGGMGAVFAAEHLRLRKQVALKIIRAEFASNTVAEQRFAREATATATLEHPHVASAIDYGTLPDGGAFLVTQLVRGVSLARHLHEAGGRMRWAVAAELAAQVADALAAAHAAGIVHRDLKPDNILVETHEGGRLHAKVVDFGIARLTAEAAGTMRPLTKMGAIIGTPGYWAPEQAVGEAVDARGDLYALGVILWECCAGRRLWAGDDLMEMISIQLGSTAPTLQQELGGQVPAALSELVAQLLVPAPSQRPASASAVRDALRRIASGQAHASMPGISAATSTIALPRSIVPATRHGWTSLAGVTLRQRGVWVGVGVALVSLVAVLAALAGGGDEAFVEAEAEEAIAEAEIDAPAEPEPAPVVAPVVVAAPPVVAPVEPPVDVDEPDVAAEPATPEVPPSPPVVAGATALAVPAGLVDDLAVLAGDDSRKARKRAAAVVLGHKPKAEVPLFALNVAWLEKAGSCGNKRAVIDKIEADGDPRALPALRRLSRVRRSGCGWWSAQDCLGCLRGTLSHAIAYLEGRAAAAK
jgi:tRNA A-37 threonylcarbamoyl transferase component Bud32